MQGSVTSHVSFAALPQHIEMEVDITDDTEFEIAVDYKTSTEKWTATLTDGKTEIVREGEALCAVLHDVANEIERRNIYSSDKFDASATEMRKRCKKCTYCNGRIFFAETINGKWMPVDSESVPVTMLGSTRGYQLRAVNGGSRAPQVTPITRRFEGQAWIAHQGVCGSCPVPPDSPLLRQRWETNRGVTLQQTTDAVRDLARMASSLRDD